MVGRTTFAAVSARLAAPATADPWTAIRNTRRATEVCPTVVVTRFGPPPLAILGSQYQVDTNRAIRLLPFGAHEVRLVGIELDVGCHRGAQVAGSEAVRQRLRDDRPR